MRAVAWGLVLAVLLPAGTPALAHAQTGMTGSVVPAELVLPPGGTATGVLVLANSGPTPIAVNVRPVPAGKSVTVDVPSPPPVVPAAGAITVDFTVTRTAEGSGQDVPVQFVLTYGTQTVMAAMTVKAGKSAALIEAELKSGVTAINEHRPGDALLVLTNPRETPVTVDELAVTAPNATTVTVTCPRGKVVGAPGHTTTSDDCPLAIGARQQEVLPVRFDADKSVTPGPRSAMIRVHVVDGTTSASVVAAIGFSVDVFGESDLLGAVGVPALLVLPGVIILLTLWFLIKHISPWREAAKNKDIGKDIGGTAATASLTAILGVALSLSFAWLYPTLTRMVYPRIERNYLESYGFVDFYYVFTYSLAIPVLLWGIVSLVWLGTRWLAVPRPGDAPAALVRKMGIQGLFMRSALFPVVAVGSGGRGVGIAERGGDRTLVAPRVMVVLNDDATKTAVEGHAVYDHPVRLWLKLLRSRKRWAYKAGDIPSPAYVDRAAAVPTGQSGPLVKLA